MLRTHTCGDLRLGHSGQSVTLSGWVQRIRDKGGLIWIDLRDRYGITQLLLEEGKSDSALIAQARNLGREFVIQVQGTVAEREAKNDKLPTGDVEIRLTALRVFNSAKTPPFTIEDHTDGGEDLRMKYRYLDLRRTPLRQNIFLRHRLSMETRKYLDAHKFIEVETPVLIKSTPEGARDFVVPSRMNAGEFYALPQSPQTFKQLLMVSGFDRYYQIVKCFRDEDLRADRQPEFTQIDCEMSFVDEEDIFATFEGLVRHLFKTVKNTELPPLPRMRYADAMRDYGCDKPDLRFGMKFIQLNEVTQVKAFPAFNEAELVVGICAENCAFYTRKQIDMLTEFVKRPQIGAKGLVYVRVEADGQYKSSIDKFFTPEDLARIVQVCAAKPGDLILILSGPTVATRKAMSELRLLMGKQMGLMCSEAYAALWVTDFPLLEWSEETNRWHAMHHPFTAPHLDDMGQFSTAPERVRARAYDMVINGAEVGGGSIRIHDKATQQLMFAQLGFTETQARQQFGFLMEAFEYGAPPHGGIAFGFDRLCALLGGGDSIRDFIAFPKNNAGRDMMIDTPAALTPEQLSELHIRLAK